MKFNILQGFACLSLLFFSCKKDNALGDGFPMQYRQEFSIPAGLNVFAVHHFYLKNIPSHYADLLTDNQKTDAEIKSIVLEKAALSGVFGDANFDFVEEASVRVYLETAPDDWLEFAYRQPTPLDPGNTLDLIPSLGNTGTSGSVKKYLQEPRFSLDVALRLRRTTTDETTTRLDLLFRAIH